jgi:hypothetical protein
VGRCRDFQKVDAVEFPAHTRLHDASRDFIQIAARRRRLHESDAMTPFPSNRTPRRAQLTCCNFCMGENGRGKFSGHEKTAAFLVTSMV